MAKCALVFDNVSGIKKNQFPDVYILPIPIIENTKDKINEYFENETITNDEIITKLNNGVVFKTSQTIPRDLFKLLDVLADKYDKVFVFPNPPQISRQYENIKMHAADYKNVYVFEHNAIGPYCLWMCEHFLKLNKTNKLTVDYIKKYLEENKHKIAAALIVPEIKYLVRSGRIHPAKGAIGKLLNIKVVICYTDAGLVPYKVTRNVNKLGEIAVNCIKEKLPNFTPDKIVNYSLGINGYSGKSFNLINIKNDISKLLKPPKKVRVDNLPLSAIVTCHTGPNYVLLCVKVK